MPICARTVGSVRMYESETSRTRFQYPASLAEIRTTSASCGARGAPGRPSSSVSPKSSATWHPMIGWMPFSAILSANSSAPNRLPVSAMPSAGILSPAASSASRFIGSAPSSSEKAEWTRRWTKPTPPASRLMKRSSSRQVSAMGMGVSIVGAYLSPALPSGIPPSDEGTQRLGPDPDGGDERNNSDQRGSITKVRGHVRNLPLSCGEYVHVLFSPSRERQSG